MCLPLFMNWAWSPFIPVGMATVSTIHCPFSCVGMNMKVKFIDWVQHLYGLGHYEHIVEAVRIYMYLTGVDIYAMHQLG